MHFIERSIKELNEVLKNLYENSTHHRVRGFASVQSALHDCGTVEHNINHINTSTTSAPANL